MSLQDYKKGEKIIECECGCSKIVVDLFDWNDKEDEVGISFTSNYLGNKRNKLKALLNCFKNKETYYAEVLINRGRAIRFFEEVLEMLKDES